MQSTNHSSVNRTNFKNSTEIDEFSDRKTNIEFIKYHIITKYKIFQLEIHTDDFSWNNLEESDAQRERTTETVESRTVDRRI